MLNINLPDYYKEVVMHNPVSDIKKFNITCILDNAEEIVEINNKFRNQGYQNKHWPPKYYLFGFMKSGAHLFINIDNNKKENIYLVGLEDKFNPEKIGHLKNSNNFEKLIKTLRMLQKVAK